MLHSTGLKLFVSLHYLTIPLHSPSFPMHSSSFPVHSPCIPLHSLGSPHGFTFMSPAFHPISSILPPAFHSSRPAFLCIPSNPSPSRSKHNSSIPQAARCAAMRRAQATSPTRSPGTGGGRGANCATQPYSKNAPQEGFNFKPSFDFSFGLENMQQFPQTPVPR